MDQATFDEFTSLHQHSFANRSMGTHYSNTGFSLAIANLLVKAMGSTCIQVLNHAAEAQYGFSFAINCHTVNDNAVLINVTESSNKRVPTKRVLVAEDNYINQVLCQCLLKKQGYTCDVAKNGKEALEKYQPNHFDFILMDIAMPELNGIEVTRRIRELEKERKISTPTFIIGLSAYAQPEKIVEAIEAGMNDFISKPATFDKIVNIIAQWADADVTKKKNKEEMVSQNMTSPKSSKKSKRPVLIVEDNMINQTLLKTILKKQGEDVVLASTGPEVIEKFKPGVYSIIFMDLTLPIMSGIEVTKKIRQIEADQQASPAVIVGLSAHSDDQLIETAKQAGMNDYMTKPASMEKIYLMLQKWVTGV
jgi:CheY-like chemotaxis protein